MSAATADLPVGLVDPTWLHTLTTDEMEVAYHDRGSGPVLVMIGAWGPRPGATASLAYRAVCDVLSRSYRCVVVELPNYGLTGPVEYHEPVHDVASRAVLAVLDDLGIERVPVIGTSMGATTAIDLALAHPERVESLVIGACHASTGGDPYLLAPFPSEVWRLSVELDEKPEDADRLRRMLRALWFDENLVTDELVSTMVEIRRLRSAHGLVDRASVSVPHSNMAALGGLELPVTVIHGRDDRMVPYEQALAIGSYIRHADIRLLGRCGHWPPFERPDAFVDAVRSHLAVSER